MYGWPRNMISNNSSGGYPNAWPIPRTNAASETNPDMAGTDEFNRSARIALPAYAAALGVRK